MLKMLSMMPESFHLPYLAAFCCLWFMSLLAVSRGYHHGLCKPTAIEKKKHPDAPTTVLGDLNQCKDERMASLDEKMASKQGSGRMF